jgi:beta-glucosidase-like glycosyl hydrolase
VRTVRAGSDVVLVCKTPAYVREAHRALAEALEIGEIDAERDRQSERRREKLIARARKSGSVRVARDAIGAHSHQELASRFA